MSWSARVDDVGKRYVKYEDLPLLLTRLFRLRGGHRKEELWAVRNVSLELAAGETVGVIGRNGSGKSTMLRLLAGVTGPTEGTVEVRGRVSPLIAVGVGFHPELTGRENVYVNGMILGLKRRQIDDLYDSIVDFSEVEHFINTPVKFYSSGMLVRLGFSVAVAAAPDVLLVDEVLAVGDVSFQQKCFERMEEIRNGGTSVLVVSHNMNGIRNMCSRALVLHDGLPRFLGATEEAISVYHDVIGSELDEDPEFDSALRPKRRRGRDPSKAVAITELELLGSDGRKTGHVTNGDEVTVRLRANFHRSIPDASFTIMLTTESGTVAYTDSTLLSGTRPYAAGDEADVDIKLPIPLAGGSYRLQAGVAWGEDENRRRSTRGLMFFVSGRSYVKGVVDLKASFEVRAGGGGAPGGPAKPSEDDLAVP